MVAHCSSWRHRPSGPPPRVVSVAWVFRALERATTVSQDSRNGWVRAWWVLVRACYCVPVTAWVIKLSAAGCGAPGGRLGPKVAAPRLASPVVVESGREPYPLCGPEAPTHGERGGSRIPAMVLVKVHLQKLCSDFYFLKIVCHFSARSQPGPPHKGGAPI